MEQNQTLKDQLSSRQKCNRCGECCSRGGPALHVQDKPLVEQKHIPLHQLYTIRAGEPAHDNVQGGIIWVKSDIIKIKGKGNSWECIYFGGDTTGCRIYRDRPMECRIFKCWDTAVSQEQYSKQYLVRSDLLSKIAGLWELVIEHQSRCSYEIIERITAETPLGEKLREEETILDMISFDSMLRSKATAHVNIDPRWTDFLFGQPLSATLKRLNIETRLAQNKYHLIRKSVPASS